jgi:hypothetical protein
MIHFSKTTSPLLTICIAYFYITIIILILYFTEFYEDNIFFRWGPPIIFFNKKIESQISFYCIHIIIFLHQFINNWVNDVVYPWIINNIQDPKNKHLEYSKSLSLLIINLFNIYSNIDVIFILLGFNSQISFVITIIFANIISSTYINNKYINIKESNEEIDKIYFYL